MRLFSTISKKSNSILQFSFISVHTQLLFFEKLPIEVLLGCSQAGKASGFEPDIPRFES